MSTGTRVTRGLLTVALLGVTLAACAAPGTTQQPTNPPGPASAGETAAIPGASYPAPGTATTEIAPTGAPAVTAEAPTSAPASSDTAAPTAATGTTSLVGPEWTVAATGDFDLDGRADVIAWKPSTVQKGPTFGQPLYANYVGPASEMVIVHAGADGRPQLRFQAGQGGLFAGDRALVSFASSGVTRPAALMFQVNLRGVPSLVDVLQVNASGEPYAQGIGVRWNTAERAYRVTAAGGK
jgi:hypothetical protein